MKNYFAKVVVNIKPSVKDIKGLTLKQAVENLLTVENLNCRVGNLYSLNFNAKSESEARSIVDKIAQEILSNDVIETYEILSVDEIHE